jgi:hypothetical protein
VTKKVIAAVHSCTFPSQVHEVVRGKVNGEIELPPRRCIVVINDHLFGALLSHAQIKVKASGSARLLRCIYTTERRKMLKNRVRSREVGERSEKKFFFVSPDSLALCLRLENQIENPFHCQSDKSSSRDHRTDQGSRFDPKTCPAAN